MPDPIAAGLGLGVSDFGVYPERPPSKERPLDRVLANAWGQFSRRWRTFLPEAKRFVERVTAQESGMRGSSDSELSTLSRELRHGLRRCRGDQALYATSFALVREVARRQLGMRHFDVQVMGGLALLSGHVAEMETGEGKTLTATLAAATVGMAGIPVHIITVNDYLAQRDADLMRPIYAFLNLSVGAIQSDMTPETRRANYSRDICYCTNKELVFDYLKDRIAVARRPGKLQVGLAQLHGAIDRARPLLLRGLHFGIVDEADSIFVDEARTPLIISAKRDAAGGEAIYKRCLEIAQTSRQGEHYRLDEKHKDVVLTGHGKVWLDQMCEGAITLLHPNQSGREELLKQALSALHFFKRDAQYVVDDGKIKIIDEFTGRLMPDRSWERGLHQMIEVKEGCALSQQNETLSRITYQRFFRRFLWLSGMTGTATEIASELWSVYRLRVVRIPTNKASQRKSIGVRVYKRQDDKWEAIAARVHSLQDGQRPILIGTRSVEASERVNRLLQAKRISHTVLNAKHDREEAEIVSRAGLAGVITVATNMAGRGTDIKLDAKIAEAGGLHVILTEFHESARIDRQLYGRGGRQGDPGSYQAFASLEDELFARFGNRWLPLLRLFGGNIYAIGWNRCADWIRRLAQASAERQNRLARRDSMKMDEQLDRSLAFTGRPE